MPLDIQNNHNKVLYIFAFTKFNISARVMYALSGISTNTASNNYSIENLIAHKYLLFKHKTIERYLKFLLVNKPKYILGLGQYTGRDQDRIRIEQIAKNKFRNATIELKNTQTVKLPLFLKPEQYSKYASGMGTGWCNFVSYKIASLINAGKINSKFTFLHIPKRMEILKAIKEISSLVKSADFS